MNRLSIVFFLIIFPFAVLGQNTPRWLDASYRDFQYPVNTFYSGFVSADATNETLKNVENEAKRKLIESIRVNIKSELVSESVDKGTKESLREYNKESLQSSAEAEIAGITVESYKSNNTVYAFAYVNKYELLGYYKSSLTVDLNKVETVIDESNQLVAAGKKMSAKRKIEEAKTIFERIQFYRNLLVAVNPNANENDLQTQRYNNLQRTVLQMSITLEQSTFVFLECSYELKNNKEDNAFERDPGIFCDILAQALSENECSVTEKKEEADYILTIITSTTKRHHEKYIMYYADVKGRLFNCMTQKKTVEFSILNEFYDDGQTPERAATKAFRNTDLRKKVLNMILPKIKD